jgi:hypothetical protein
MRATDTFSRWGVPVTRIGVSQEALRTPGPLIFEDPGATVSTRRLRAMSDDVPLDEDVLRMATMIRAGTGGPLRTFSGGLAHENGWYRAAKSPHLLHWEGETAFLAIVAAEVDSRVARINTESVGFELPLAGDVETYTADLELIAPDGVVTLTEIKRDEHDLDDPAYRLKLAYVREICRRCGIRFAIRYRQDLFRSARHRRNACLFASRAFADVQPFHLDRLADHRRANGASTTYAALASALEPAAPVFGAALVQGLLVARRVTMNLAATTRPWSPVTIA